MALIKFSDNQRLLLAFLIALLSTLFIPLFFPHWHLLFFAPFLIITYYKKTLVKALWISLICGVIIDLLSSYSLFGLHAFTYSITTLLLYWQKRNFFPDSHSTIPLMTFFFSLLSTLFLLILLFLTDHPVPLSLITLETDFLLMPLADALYGYVLFALPPFMPRRSQREYFFK